MGAEYSQPQKYAALTGLISDMFPVPTRGGPGRCVKCSGHGKIFVEYECRACRWGNQAAWSDYVTNCSCNGYGRETAYEICDDCFGRGIK